MPPKSAKQIEAELKKITKLDGNKTCCDCPERVPGYADLTNNVFVCTKCAGIHRDFQFKIKGVSMTVFSEDDVAGLANMGNAAFNSVYLARLNTREYAMPNGNDTVKLKDFIRQKYVEKKWHRDFGTAGIAASSLQGNTTGGSLPETRDVPSPAPGRINISLNKTGSFSGSRRASTGSVEVATKRSTSSDLAGDLMGLSVSNDPFGSSPSHASNDPFATGTSTASTISNHDPFSTPAPASATSNHDPFGAPSNHSFDAFGIGAPASAATTFDPFGSSAPAPASNGGFSAFDQAPAAPVNAFAPSMTMAPMPYIRTAPPPPPAAPVPEKVEVKETKPHEKNFSAFDDLISLPVAQPPSLTAPSNNPFEAGGAAPAAPAGPYGAPQPGYAAHGNVPPNGPYGVPPGAHYGYAPQPGPYGVPPQMAYPPAPGYGYPPAGYGAPPPGYYMPQGPPAGAPSAGPYGVHGGAPQPGYGAAPAPQPNQQPAAAPAQPDPFAAMGSLAWGAVGGMPQLPPAASLSPTAAAAPVAPQPAPAPVYPAASFGVSPPAASVTAAPAPASVNPFDLF